MDEPEFIPDHIYEAIANATRLLYESLEEIKSQLPEENWDDMITESLVNSELRKLEEIDAIVEQNGTKEANELLNEIFK